MPTLEQQLLALVAEPHYHPVKPRVLARRLQVPRDELDEFKRLVKRLVRSGRLRYGEKHLVLPPDGSAKDHARREREGVFQRTAGGFGFVRLDQERDDDIYIPADRSADAASGDRVRLHVSNKRGRYGKRRGEILEVIERSRYEFVGTLERWGGRGAVHVDGGQFSMPVPVEDPSARNALDGDKVVLEMVQFPTATTPGEGVILEVLGPKGAPGVDTLSIIREYGLPDEFPEDVLAGAREQSERFEEGVIPEGRTDLTGVPTLTIDPADARDFDDAVSLSPRPDGGWRLGVHIADVSFFVPVGSVLDAEARRRATSVYLPDRVLPMLPEVISNHLASLQPERVRLARSVFIDFDADGTVLDDEIVRSVIRSDHRFTYEEVDELFADPESWKARLSPEVWQLVLHMRELARTLRQRRKRLGSLELALPEVKIELDDEGRVSGARKVEHTESHQVIEEFMLAANQSVARWLDDRDVLFLRRIHPPPAPRKLKDLTRFVRLLGLETESLESRFEIQRVVDQVAGEPDESAVNYAILRSMQKAVYGPQEEGHYALHFDHYCHFTSPIRRYPDLDVHRRIDAVLSGKRPVQDFEMLRGLGDHCSECEQRAEMAERELVKIKLLTYLSDHLGSQLEAVVTGVEDFGVFAQGVKLPAEGLIPTRSLRGDDYRYDEASRSLVGHGGHTIRLGDLVRVEIAHVDVEARKLEMRLVGRPRHRRGKEDAGKDGPKRKNGRDGKGRGKSGRKKGGKGKGKKGKGHRGR